MIILSYFQAHTVIQAIKSGNSQVETSLDLNLTKITVQINGQNVLLPDGQRLTLKQLQKIAKKSQQCFLVENDEIKPINIFSETTGWMRTLYPTTGAPTTKVAGILMHRIRDVDPWEDTKIKVAALGKVRGAKILDTATGLGYTAIQAAGKSGEVVTVEIDPAALELAKFNPWSRVLFGNPQIKQVIGDILDQIKEFNAEEFDIVIHDPPTMKLSGELYSEEFYRQLFRVLKRGGKLFHYIGDPESEHGSIVTKGVIIRLKRVGFKKVEKLPQAFAVMTQK